MENDSKHDKNKKLLSIFRKGGSLPNKINYKYNDFVIEIVNKFCYLGVLFTSGGSSFETQKTLAGQSLKAIFTFRKYLYNFTTLKPFHVLAL